jgi:hypothetical protein
MKHIIVLIKDDQLEAWGCMTELCAAHESFSYAYLKSKKFPFDYKGHQFRKLPYRQAVINS